MRTQEDIYERLCMMLEDNRQDPLGFRRESLLEFTTHETLNRILEEYPNKIPEIPDSDEWIPLELKENIVHSRIRDRINIERKRPSRRWKGPDILDLRAAHRIEAYVWLLGDDKALEQFERPRAFIGDVMIGYFMDRYNLAGTDADEEEVR